jgi:hypothetical protein
VNGQVQGNNSVGRRGKLICSECRKIRSKVCCVRADPLPNSRLHNTLRNAANCSACTNRRMRLVSFAQVETVAVRRYGARQKIRVYNIINRWSNTTIFFSFATLYRSLRTRTCLLKRNSIFDFCLRMLLETVPPSVERCYTTHGVCMDSIFQLFRTIRCDMR